MQGECPKVKGTGRQCFNCHGHGHIARDCPKQKADEAKEGKDADA